jgi:hypothetical protein
LKIASCFLTAADPKGPLRAAQADGEAGWRGAPCIEIPLPVWPDME